MPRWGVIGVTNFTVEFTNDQGLVLEVDGTMRVYRDSIEIESYKAWLLSDRDNVDAPAVALSSDEDQRLHEQLCLDPSTWEYDDGF